MTVTILFWMCGLLVDGRLAGEGTFGTHQQASEAFRQVLNDARQADFAVDRLSMTCKGYAQ
jgi:hypothetical protein